MKETGEYEKTFIAILDACRTEARGIEALPVWETSSSKTPSGSIFCYAASRGEDADNGNTRNGLYTSLLLKYIETPNLRIEDMFIKIRNDIRKQGLQEPEETGKLYKLFYFKR